MIHDRNFDLQFPVFVVNLDRSLSGFCDGATAIWGGAHSARGRQFLEFDVLLDGSGASEADVHVFVSCDHHVAFLIESHVQDRRAEQQRLVAACSPNASSAHGVQPDLLEPDLVASRVSPSWHPDHKSRPLGVYRQVIDVSTVVFENHTDELPVVSELAHMVIESKVHTFLCRLEGHGDGPVRARLGERHFGVVAKYFHRELGVSERRVLGLDHERAPSRLGRQSFHGKYVFLDEEIAGDESPACVSVRDLHTDHDTIHLFSDVL